MRPEITLRHGLEESEYGEIHEENGTINSVTITNQTDRDQTRHTAANNKNGKYGNKTPVLALTFNNNHKDIKKEIGELWRREYND